MRERHVVNVRPTNLGWIYLAHIRYVVAERLVRSSCALCLHEGLALLGEEPVDKNRRGVRMGPPVDYHEGVAGPAPLEEGPLLDRPFEEPPKVSHRQTSPAEPVNIASGGAREDCHGILSLGNAISNLSKIVGELDVQLRVKETPQVLLPQIRMDLDGDVGPEGTCSRRWKGDDLASVPLVQVRVLRHV